MKLIQKVTAERQINYNNLSLVKLRKALLPFCARNRWLAENHYLPPFYDNYWFRAAKYWLLYLNEHDDLLESKPYHEMFKHCVEDMGVLGLKAVLNYLNKAELSEHLLMIYGSKRPVFYLACPPDEIQPYLDMLTNHLHQGQPFPFSKLGVAYQPGNDKRFIQLIELVNQCDTFEQIQLTQCIHHKQAFAAFLQDLSREALKHQWTSVIIISELENEQNLKEEYRELHSLYRQLNNILLHHRHLKQGSALATRIREASWFDDLPKDDSSDIPIPDLNPDRNQTPTFTEHEKGPWPMQRGGAVQLQMQQQQDIQQSRQVQQEQQKMQMQMMDQVITSELITYTSIDKLLSEYYRLYKENNPFNPKYATLWNKDNESELQGFFHTWINANPHVNAPNIIQAMTQDAAKMLLRHHARVSSGFHLDNLPKGFYVQRSKSGGLILCYDADIGIGYITPLTLNLDVPLPNAELWEGDFRLFDVQHYVEHPHTLKTRNDFIPLLAFEALQPEHDYTKEYQRFLTEHPDIKTLVIGTDVNVCKHWLVFFQAWQYQGVEGIRAFLLLHEDQLTLSDDEIYHCFLAKQSLELIAWTKRAAFSRENLISIAQVYYFQGDAALTLLLTKLRQIESTLGPAFFHQFKTSILSRCNNSNRLMSPPFFKAMDDMIIHLSPTHAKNHREAFLQFCVLHLECVGWESIETLWHAFDYIIKTLTDMGLDFDETILQEFPPQNMLVAFDRILTSLRHAPGQASQLNFLKSLTTLDLTEGGVHYALQHEHFNFFEEALELHDFTGGQPTYSPHLKHLYEWSDKDTDLNIRRIFASNARIKHDDYHYLSNAFAHMDNARKKQALMWMLVTQYDKNNVEHALANIEALPREYIELIGYHLHRAAYIYGHSELQISLQALITFNTILMQESTTLLLKRYPHGNFLEALTILVDCCQTERLDAVVSMFSLERPKPTSVPEFLYNDAYKIATLFRASSDDLDALLHASSHLKLAVQHEVHLLFKHLLSINYLTSDLKALDASQNWRDLITCIQSMNQHPSKRQVLNADFIHALTEKNIYFKQSKTQELRYLLDNERPLNLNFFVDHQSRLWSFLKDHVVIPVDADAKQALNPVIAFFKRLQLNNTYLNEVEPLLAMLEKTTKHHAWSAQYFIQMIDALKSDDDQTSFPFEILNVMINDPMLGPKPLDLVENHFPKDLLLPLKQLIANTTFDRTQQAQLCQLLLHEFSLTKTTPLFNETVEVLANEQHRHGRNDAIKTLLTCTTVHELTNRLEKLKRLLNHARSDVTQEHWPQTTSLWLKAITEHPDIEPLLNTILSRVPDDRELRRAQILHLLGWSGLYQGLRSDSDYRYELHHKLPRLLERVFALPDDELTRLCHCYPKQPSPSPNDLIGILTKHERGEPLEQALQAFLCNPYPDLRADYQWVAKTRRADLQRMLTETRIIDGEHSHLLTPEQTGRISMMFSHLKQLEQGIVFIDETTKPVSQLTQAELAEAFHRLSKGLMHHPNNDTLQTQVWALLFEAIGRTTRKYPHMAQQFALIANSVALSAPSTVLQLATGEGKSHFVALRAAYHAAQGNVVDVCTAKRSLAQRDLADYHDFFHYLKLTATVIEPKSKREAYLDEGQTQGRIHYSTLGDLSLFLDEQCFQGRPIDIDPKRRIGLGDELDFIYFDEGRKTEYNYARPTGRTPKKMIWFYEAINQFYNDHKHDLEQHEITQDIIKTLVTFLYDQALNDDDKRRLVDKLTRDGMQLVGWLQSAHEAHQLEKGVGFTVREEPLVIGDASYLMKEIIPLSTDNQKVIGSSFSAGVHQLLAVRLNNEAKANNESQNYHVHAESHIISSQVASKLMRTLWGHWEGFTGTISHSQAQALKQTQNTHVIQVSTNQRDLRFWHPPSFYQKADARLLAMIAQLKTCLRKKQSILFSCKNDQQVEWIKDELTKRLTPQELEQLIFYTNEDKESSLDILNKKHHQEGWQGGKKQRGIGLVASGFGRGDNVDVEAVFLFDANDINDLKQKGGRTARNGEEGEVFQFYVVDEMEQEFKRLNAIISQTPGVDTAALQENLETTVGNSEQEKQFNKIILLREYVFNLQNSANQGYHAGVAQFSGWGMSLAGKLMDPMQRSEFIENLTSMMHHLEKQWLLISSEKALTPTEKVRAIEHIIDEQQQQLWGDYQSIVHGSLASATALILEPYPDILLSLTPQSIEETTSVSRDLAFLGSLIASLPRRESHAHASLAIPSALKTLASNPDVLHEFIQDAGQFSTVDALIKQLAIRLKHIESPSQSYQEARRHAVITPDKKHLFRDIDSDKKELFLHDMGKLLPSLQDKVYAWLTQPGLATAPSRVNKVAPLIRYLTHFSEEEQTQWAEDYLHQLNTLWLHSSDTSLATRFSGQPMRFDDNHLLWSLITSVTTDLEKARALFLQLQHAIKGDSFVKRLRMLTRAEGLIHRLPEADKSPFLESFAQIMAHTQEGRDWDMFINLVDKTARWWNKHDGAHRKKIQTLWQTISTHSLADSRTILEPCLDYPGSAWMSMAELGLSFHQMPSVITPILKSWGANPGRKTHASWILEEFNRYSLSEPQKIHLLRQEAHGALEHQTFLLCCQMMDHLNDVLIKTSVFSQEQKQALHQTLLSLPIDNLVSCLNVINQNPEILRLNPYVIEGLLTTLSHHSITPKRAEKISQLVLTLGHRTINDPTTFNHLLTGVARYQNPSSSDDDLQRLLMLLTGDDALPAEQILFDNVAHYLENNIQSGQQHAAKNTIDLFYRLAKTHRGDPDRMFHIKDNAELKEMFDFKQQRQSLKSQRVIWMHLLNHDAFVTGARAEKALETHHYQWTPKQNQDLLKRGLDLYLIETRRVLKDKPKAHTGLDRDLSKTQQVELFRLANEMALIGQPQLTSTQTVSANMLNDLNTLTGHYKQQWFKSNTRHQQFEALQKTIEKTLQSHEPSSTLSRYEQLITLFQNARLQAMRDDLENNKSRWFKLNRGAHSRYFSTLNQMEDLIVRHWVMDKNDIQRFQHIIKPSHSIDNLTS